MKFVLASHNPGKLKEMQEVLGQLGVEVVLQPQLGIQVDVEETGTTFAENALLKTQAVCAASGLPAISDDSGLCVDALNGAPGVYTARYGGEGLTDEQRYRLLLRNLQGLPPGPATLRRPSPAFSPMGRYSPPKAGATARWPMPPWAPTALAMTRSSGCRS